jgi:hypothetical protein
MKTTLELLELMAIFLTMFAAIIGIPLLVGHWIGKTLGAF